MEYDIDPVYINDIDVNSIHGNVVLKTCYAVQNFFPGEIHGAQRLNNHMKIYLRSEVARAALVVRGIDIDTKHISVHNTNPTHFVGKGLDQRPTPHCSPYQSDDFLERPSSYHREV